MVSHFSIHLQLIISLGISLLLCSVGRTQSLFVLNNDPYVILDNNVKLVVENSAPNAITTLGTGGNIVTESEFDQIVWNIGTSVGTYIVPFTTQSSFTKIPFTADITGAGLGNGSILFSTYPGSNWDNNTFRPSDVTHMFDQASGSFNNSSHVIDRFWIVDASGYGTKPTATFQFSYRDSEHLQAGNTIAEADLGAQRFNSSTNHWGDYLPTGTTNATTNTTSNVIVTPVEFYRSWTLSEVANPLSADLAYLQSSCENGTLVLNWTVLLQNNTDHYEIEYYNDGQYIVIGIVPAKGTEEESYTFVSEIERQGVFRLVEIDTDGNRSEKSTISASCVGIGKPIVFFINGTLQLSFDGELENGESLYIYDATGKLITKRDVEIKKGNMTVLIPDLYLSKGLYTVVLRNGLSYINEKIMISE